MSVFQPDSRETFSGREAFWGCPDGQWRGRWVSGGVNHSQISKGRESVLPTIRKPAPQSLVMVTPVPLPPTPPLLFPWKEDKVNSLKGRLCFHFSLRINDLSNQFIGRRHNVSISPLNSSDTQAQPTVLLCLAQAVWTQAWG